MSNARFARFVRLADKAWGVRIVGLARPVIGSVVDVATYRGVVTKVIVAGASIQSLGRATVWHCRITEPDVKIRSPKNRLPTPRRPKKKPLTPLEQHCTDCGGKPYDGGVCARTGMRHGGRS